MGAKQQESPRSLGEEDIKLLKETLTLPLTKLSGQTPTKQPLKGFVKPNQGKIEHGPLPEKRTNEGFDPNAYKLLAKAGFDFGSPSKEDDQIISKKAHELNESQKKLREQGNSARAGLGFAPSKPIKISRRRKGAQASTQYIGVEEVEDDVPQCHHISRTSAFDRICPSSQSTTTESTSRVSVFERVDRSTSRSSVFNRLDISATRTSVFKRLTQSNEENKQVEPTPRKSALERIQAPKEQGSKRKEDVGQMEDKEI